VQCNHPLVHRVSSSGPSLLLGAGLSKRFRDVAALDNVTIALQQGTAVALLGPNGAGKTTLLRILAGASSPSAGSVKWEAAAAVGVGWVPHTPAVYRRLTARENLRLFAALESAPQPDVLTEALLARADLMRFADTRAGELSTGTLQRLNLAIALAGRPSVLLLDEPTATLSPDQVRRLWTWLDELRYDDGLAVLFSTQSVDEAVRHSERMMVLNAGRSVFDGTAGELIRTYGTAGSDETGAAEAAFLNLVGEPA
jgi:ABC-2 type transport system ATP-binding protein